MTVVLIVGNRVHQVLKDQTDVPKWPSYHNGEVPLLVQAHDDVKQGDIYDPATGEISSPQGEDD